MDKRKSKLSDIRSREQRTQFAVTLYTVSAYVLYVVLWYMRSLPPLVGMGIRVPRDAEKALKGMVVLVGPVLCVAHAHPRFKLTALTAFLLYDVWYRYGIHARGMPKVCLHLIPSLTNLMLSQRSNFKLH